MKTSGVAATLVIVGMLATGCTPPTAAPTIQIATEAPTAKTPTTTKPPTPAGTIQSPMSDARQFKTGAVIAFSISVEREPEWADWEADNLFGFANRSMEKFAYALLQDDDVCRAWWDFTEVMFASHDDFDMNMLIFYAFGHLDTPDAKFINSVAEACT